MSNYLCQNVTCDCHISGRHQTTGTADDIVRYCFGDVLVTDKDIEEKKAIEKKNKKMSFRKDYKDKRKRKEWE